ncbi:T4 family baseplate hub assembly chaperone [Microcoleus sp. OTE_8_concoct_300]|uniref:T4 family baseplate hub assembly chaperone n=1 Tax=Microcoleus sp. OTE_8_concoct_300 TaxID=2964710 RepID=UPI00403F1FF4
MLRSDITSNVTSSSGIDEEKTKLFLRPFGWFAEDLEIDFHQTRRPDLEMQILECCISNREEAKLDSSFFGNLEIGKRTEYLLTLASLSNSSKINLNLRCSNLECQRQMEITIPLLEITRLQQQSENQKTEIAIANEKISLRKPTGNDQRLWQEQHFSDEGSATLAMVQSLLVSEQPSTFKQVYSQEKDWIEMLNQVMEEIDPLVNFNLQVICPYCGSENLQYFDLGAWALQQLYGVQQQLIVTIHRLASHYHWSESEILAIPPGRRSRYLALIDREENYR